MTKCRPGAPPDSPLRQIAEALGMGRRTVDRFLRTRSFPERRPRTVAVTPLDPYHAYLRERWAAGCHNAAQLWREIQAQGYQGGYRSVHAWLITLEGPIRQVRAANGMPQRPTAQRKGGPAVRRRDWRKYSEPATRHLGYRGADPRGAGVCPRAGSGHDLPGSTAI